MFDFLATATGGKLTRSEESPEVGWFARDAVLGMITHPMIRERMRIMLADLKRVVYRAYSKSPYRVHRQIVVG